MLSSSFSLQIFRANSSRAALTNGAIRYGNKQLDCGRGTSGTAELGVSANELSQCVESSDLLKTPTTSSLSPALLQVQKLSPVLGHVKPNPSGDVATGSLRMTVMLLSVSFTFMLTTLPMTISNIIANTVINTGHNTDRTVAQGLLVHTLALLLMYLNHSVNFLLYCVTGKKFRKVVTRMYSAKVCALIQRKSMESTPMDHSDHLYCSRGNVCR